MPNGPRILVDNVFYHITARGNHKLRIFNVREDYDAFLNRLKHYKRKYKFRLYGYCLMPNHIHLLGEIMKKENLSKFMHCLKRSYTSYFNKKYDKAGHLWQGRFNSKIIIRDSYAINCINYIELNPVRGNMVTDPNKYEWSSYKERNVGIGQGNEMLDPMNSL